MSLFSTNQAGHELAGKASFLPADYVQRKSDARNNIVILTLFALVMGGVGAAFAVKNRQKVALASEYAQVRAECEAEAQKIEALKSLQDQRATMMEKAEITAALLEKVPRWAMLAELTYRMPLTMKLSEFEMRSKREVVQPPDPKDEKKDGKEGRSLAEAAGEKRQPARQRVVAPTFTYELRIAGSAEENNDIADYIASLRQSPVFRSVELAFIRDYREKDMTYRAFEFTARLRTDVDKATLAESIRGVLEQRTAKLNEEREAAKAAEAASANPAGQGQPANPAVPAPTARGEAEVKANGQASVTPTQD